AGGGLEARLGFFMGFLIFGSKEINKKNPAGLVYSPPPLLFVRYYWMVFFPAHFSLTTVFPSCIPPQDR
ncbi:hypothetical protein, partial [Collinsella sp. HCP28S3_B9]|uniref:hypothetical protein n=1 Tax=Collinsella sp. HCP28S3_B9 TaxID=3438920 RepID=UPI003F891390